jgi:hypothetical protein
MKVAFRSTAANVVEAVNRRMKMNTTEINRVPRSPDEEAALLRTKPDGWEYLLFGAILRRKLERLEPKFRDHELGLVHPHGPMLDEFEALNLVGNAFHPALQLTGNFNRILSPRATELAFGKVGEPGDPARIEHLAERLIDIYEGFLDWASELRGAGVPEPFEAVTAVASSLVDGPIRQVREFVRDLVVEFDRLPGRLRNGEDIKLKMTLVLAIEGDVQARLDDELARLTKRYGVDS